VIAARRAGRKQLLAPVREMLASGTLAGMLYVVFGYTAGFLITCACWVFLGPGFPGETKHRGGVILFLVLPHGLTGEVLGHYAEDSAEAKAWRARKRRAALRLAGLSLFGGAVSAVAELLALSAVRETDWGGLVVWLVAPVVACVTVGIVLSAMFGPAPKQ
jgi:hypothetical protein